MNQCNFVGYVTDDPVLDQQNGVSVVFFEIVVYQYRKTKGGDNVKEPTYVDLEAWHTGAEAICESASSGSKIAVACSARNDKEDEHKTYFRINEFEVL